MSERKIPDGMVPVEDFAKSNGVTPESVVKGIRDGEYIGQTIDDHWFIRPAGIGAKSGGKGKVEQNSVQAFANEPRLTRLFYFLSGLSFLGSLLMCIYFWPEDTSYGGGTQSINGAISFMWLVSGIVEAGMFAAVGSILSYLNRIALSSEIIAAAANNPLQARRP